MAQLSGPDCDGSGTNRTAAIEASAKHSERFGTVDKTHTAIQEAMQSLRDKVDKMDASVSEFKEEVKRMHALTAEMQDKSKRLSNYSPTSRGGAGHSGGAPPR